MRAQSLEPSVLAVSHARAPSPSSATQAIISPPRAAAAVEKAPAKAEARPAGPVAAAKAAPVEEDEDEEVSLAR